MLRDDVDVLPFERGRPGEHHEEGGAERVEVGLEGDAPVPRLLGRDEGDGPDEVARARERVPARLLPRETEVAELGRSLCVEEDVPGLEVAVDEPRPVDGAEPARDPRRDRERLAPRDRSLPSQAVMERTPGDELEDEVGVPLDLAVGVDPHDVGMLDDRDALGLAPEPLEAHAVRDHLARHDLERHRAAEVVLGPEDDSHPAAAELPLDDVCPESSPGPERQHGPPC